MDASAETSPRNTRTSYDAVAAIYAARMLDELAHKPFDRARLDELAARVKSAGLPGFVCDLGCGPGQVARHLQGQGVPVAGVDLSPAMVTLAGQHTPTLPLLAGDMRVLPLATDSLAGIVAFYSLIHIHPEAMPATLRELRRVLRPGGFLLVAFHRGDETIHLDTWWDQSVSVDFHFFRRETMEAWLTDAGFAIVESLERPPYSPEVEHQSHRVYLTGCKPSD